MIHNRPQFFNVQKLAHEFLLKYWDGSLPIDTLKLAYNISKNNNNFKIYTYTNLAKEFNIPIEKIKSISDDGYCYYNSQGIFILVYNDLIDDKRKVQWTIGHELGHYASNHLFKDSTIYKFSDGHTKDIHEIEADYFVKNLMAPFPLLNFIHLYYLNLLGPSDIVKISNINYTPACHIYNHFFRLTSYTLENIPYKRELEKLFRNNLTKFFENNLTENSFEKKYLDLIKKKRKELKISCE